VGRRVFLSNCSLLISNPAPFPWGDISYLGLQSYSRLLGLSIGKYHMLYPSVMTGQMPKFSLDFPQQAEPESRVGYRTLGSIGAVLMTPMLGRRCVRFVRGLDRWWATKVAAAW